MVVQSQALLKPPKLGLVKKVGVISDTHVPTRARSIPPQVFEVFQKVELILHAGDLVQLSVIRELEKLASVTAVHGNMDGHEVRAQLPRFTIVNVLDRKIGLIHDPDVLSGMSRMRLIASQSDLDILAYGHTHNPSIRREGRVSFVNPGSPTNPLPPFIAKPTVALLTITEQGVEAEIVTI